MELNDSIKQQIRNHTQKNPKEEVLGLILINKSKNLSCYPCLNTLLNKSHNGTINTYDYLQASSLGEVIGIYHSHPSNNPNFSEIDKQTSENYNLELILYCLNSDSFYQYSPKNYKYKYVGREFKIGINDCFTLVRDYYLNDLNIYIENFERNENWFKDNPKKVMQNFATQGFRIVQKAQVNDILSFYFYDNINPSHLGILIEENTLLHHPRNKISIVEKIGLSLNSRLGPIFRHARHN